MPWPPPFAQAYGVTPFFDNPKRLISLAPSLGFGAVKMGAVNRKRKRFANGQVRLLVVIPNFGGLTKGFSFVGTVRHADAFPIFAGSQMDKILSAALDVQAVK